MYETLKEKEICRILATDPKKGLTQEEARKEKRKTSGIWYRNRSMIL